MSTWSKAEFGPWFCQFVARDLDALALLDQLKTEDLEWLIARLEEAEAEDAAKAAKPVPEACLN